MAIENTKQPEDILISTLGFPREMLISSDNDSWHKVTAVGVIAGNKYVVKVEGDKPPGMEFLVAYEHGKELE